MKECKISKYLSVKKVLGAKNFKRNKMIQNGTEYITIDGKLFMSRMS